MHAPIALFVYKRLNHTQKVIESLCANELAHDSDLFIFSDGYKTEADKELVNGVREYVRSVKGFRSVQLYESSVNKGLANSIIQGVIHVLENSESVIVLEDDLVCSPFFLSYMNQALELYGDEPLVISVHGYIYPVTDKLPESFFLRGADCWGWGTWRRGWELFEHSGSKLLAELREKKMEKEFDFDDTFPFTKMLEDQIKGLNDSWAIRWYASAFLKNKLTLYPGISLIHNIGHDNTGTHSGASNAYGTMLRDKAVNLKRIVPQENRAARSAIAKYFLRISGGKIKMWLKKWLVRIRMI